MSKQFKDDVIKNDLIVKSLIKVSQFNNFTTEIYRFY